MNSRLDVHTFAIGRRTGWSLHDGTFLMPATALARNAVDAEIARVLGDALRPDRQVELQVNVMLLQWDCELVLIDAGCGTAYGDTLGFAAARLRDAGFSPADVTAVVFTHLHLDHVAGALDLDTRQLVFPNARYLALREEAAFWRQPTPDLAGTGLPPEQIAAIVHKMHDALEILDGRLELFTAGATLFDDFTVIPLPGHTPFHTGFLLRDGDEAILNAGDALIDSRLHVPHPEWHPLGDTLPMVAANTRRNLLEPAKAGTWRIFCAHVLAPGFLDANLPLEVSAH